MRLTVGSLTFLAVCRRIALEATFLCALPPFLSCLFMITRKGCRTPLLRSHRFSALISSSSLLAMVCISLCVGGSLTVMPRVPMGFVLLLVPLMALKPPPASILKTDPPDPEPKHSSDSLVRPQSHTNKISLESPLNFFRFSSESGDST